MKPLLLALLLLTSPTASAAFPPASDPIAGCENHWFLAQGKNKDLDTRMLGFAYIDPDAGFTFEAHGDVVLDAQGEPIRKPDQLEGKARLIMRVAQNVKVACLDAGTVARLGLPARSESLKFYADKRAPAEHEAMWGSHLNAIGAFTEALRHLEPARKSGYKSDLLWFETGFAYNATEQFDNAIEVLDPAVAASPENQRLIGELAFAYMHKGNFKRAIELYNLALSKYREGETDRRDQYAFNLASAYHFAGNEKAATEWMSKARAWQAQGEAEVK